MAALATLFAVIYHCRSYRAYTPPVGHQAVDPRGEGALVTSLGAAGYVVAHPAHVELYTIGASPHTV